MRARSVLLFLGGLLLLAGCDDDSAGDDDVTIGDDDDDDDDTSDDDSELALTDGHNYSFVGTLDIESFEAMEQTSILLRWDGLTTDLQGHALDPDDLDVAALAVFRYLSQEEVAQGLVENSLLMSDVSLYVEDGLEDGQTSIHLGDLTLFGNDIDVEQYFEDGYGTWLFTLNTGTKPGTGARMIAFLEPTPGSTVDEIVISDGTALVTVDADLNGLTPAELPAGQTPSLSWGGLTTDGLGNEIQHGTIDRLMVAHYATLTPSDLEAQFLDLELIADVQYDLVLEGQMEAGLATLSGDDGAFGGITADGTWILALRCDTCANPAPPFLTTLSVCE